MQIINQSLSNKCTRTRIPHIMESRRIAWIMIYSPIFFILPNLSAPIPMALSNMRLDGEYVVVQPVYETQEEPPGQVL